MDTIAKRVVELRHDMRLTQTEFAAKLGIGTSSLGMLEAGKRKFKDRHIRLISAVCGVSETWLRSGEGDPVGTDASPVVLSQLSAEKRAAVQTVLACEDEELKTLGKIALEFCFCLRDAGVDLQNH